LHVTFHLFVCYFFGWRPRRRGALNILFVISDRL
jgi:hypothetical protein